MADTLLLDYGAIGEAATKLNTEGDNINDCINNMSAVINELPDIWKADTCNSYVNQYHDLEPKMNQMVELITEMVAQMNQICSNFQETDSGMAGQI